MANCKEKLFTEFPPVSTETWMEKVTADLKGADFNKKLVWRTNEGFQVKPMYRAEDIASLGTLNSLPGEFPYVRGTRCDNEWLVRQAIVADDLKSANEKAKECLKKGVDSLAFSLQKEDISVAGLTTLLEDIDPVKTELNFSCCVKQASRLAETLTAYFAETGVNAGEAKGSIDFDPLGKRMLKKGRDIADYVKLGAELLKTAAGLPRYRVLSINAVLLNNAGSYITQELGFALSWGNAWMEKLTEAGFTADEVARRIRFNFGISSNFFMEIAKFRAARMLWAQIVAQYKPESLCAAKISVHAQTSEFNMTIYDAHVNLLRSQTEAMSAALGGVDALTVNGFDKAYKTPDEFSDRIARNQQLLLKEESHFDKVTDPSAGSYYVETLTASIATEAWKLFLETEERGGFYAAAKGFVQERVNEASQKRHAAIASRKEILLGTNQYPNLNEKAADKVAKGTCSCCCSSKEPCEKTLPTLSFERGASAFEALRMATEKAAKRPKVFMLTIGSLAMRLARSQFSGNFFGCAGYEIIDNLGFETVEAGVEAALKAKADIVVLCSSDDEYAEFAPQAQKALDGKAMLVVAGAPACMEELKALGIDQFIHVRSNVLETLQAFNAKLSI